MSRRNVLRCAFVAVLLLPPLRLISGDQGGSPAPIHPRSMTKIVFDDLTIAVSDAAGFFGAPLSFGRRDLERTAVSVGAIGIFLAMDESLNRGLAGYRLD